MGARGPQPDPHAMTRAGRMAALYSAGQTLQHIGDSYGITRERVRQVLRKHTALTRNDGGSAERARKRILIRAARYNDHCLKKWGCGADEYRRIRAIGAPAKNCRRATVAFNRQRQAARQRKIEWKLMLSQWWSIWEASGKWGERGRGQGYVMCRHGDVGPYAVGNVFIARAIENSSNRIGKTSGLPIGVSKWRGSYRAKRHLAGKGHISLSLRRWPHDLSLRAQLFSSFFPLSLRKRQDRRARRNPRLHRLR
jgi:hypothetical protein